MLLFGMIGCSLPWLTVLPLLRLLDLQVLELPGKVAQALPALTAAAVYDLESLKKVGVLV